MARKRHFLKRMTAALVSAALLALPVGAAGAEEGQQASQQPTLAICTTGDMNGRVYRQDPLTGEMVGAGYQNAAAAVEEQREQWDAVLLLDSGNAVDNSLLQDGGEAEALALRTIGYDALVPGWNELQLSPEARDDFFAALGGETGEGTPVQVLSNDVDEDAQEPTEDAYEIFTVELGGARLRIGVLGLGPTEETDALPEAYQEDAGSADQDNGENSFVQAWSGYWQGRLERENCDLVVVVCHAERDVVAEFAAQTTGIDLLVGGRGSAVAETVENADGAPVAWVSGGGSALTCTTVTLSRTGTPEVGESTLLPLEDYGSDSALARALSPLREEAEELAAESVGTLAGDWLDEGDPYYVQTDTAELAAQAMMWAAGADGALLSADSLGETVVSRLFQEGEDTLSLSLRDCAALLPGQTPIVAVELTGAQLKQWLDHCADAYTVAEDGSISGGQGADALYGLDYTLYLGAAEGERVDGLTFAGEPVEDGQVFRIVLSADHLFDPEFPDCEVLWSSSRDSRFADQGGMPAALLAAYVREQTELLSRLFPRSISTWTLYTGSVDGPLNRLEFVTMLYELAGKPQPGASAAFIDVGDSSAAVWAAETGVVSGNGQGRFLPTQTITREQVAVMLYNYARFLGVEAPASGAAASALTDYAGIAAWARPAVDFCVGAGILSGQDGQFLPGGTLTRSEAAAALEAFSACLTANP